MDSVKHYHTLKRVKHPKRRDLWMCTAPECSFRTNQMYLDGKLAQCAYCSEQFTITSRKLAKQSLLHCDNCKRVGRGAAKPKDNELPTVNELESKLREIL